MQFPRYNFPGERKRGLFICRYINEFQILNTDCEIIGLLVSEPLSRPGENRALGIGKNIFKTSAGSTEYDLPSSITTFHFNLVSALIITLCGGGDDTFCF